MQKTITTKEQTGVAIDPFLPKLVPIHVGIQDHHCGFCSLKSKFVGDKFCLLYPCWLLNMKIISYEFYGPLSWIKTLQPKDNILRAPITH